MELFQLVPYQKKKKKKEENDVLFSPTLTDGAYNLHMSVKYLKGNSRKTEDFFRLYVCLRTNSSSLVEDHFLSGVL